jgi:hypothetical protein
VLSIRNLLCAALAAGLLFSAPSAEARFGKSSSDSSDDKKPHRASAVGDDDDDDKSSGGSSSSHSYSAGSFLVDLLFAIFVNPRPEAAYAAPVQPLPSGEVQSSPSRPSPLNVRLGVDGAALNIAAGLGAFLGVEGERVGLDARAMALILPTDDGTQGTDSITLTNVHLTYALIAQERVRLRAEGGFSSAHAPDLTALAPSFALSMEACLVGNLDIELRAPGTPGPYRQLDGQAGLALHLNALVLRGWWRGLYLNDNGLVDDVEHEDVLGGPYLGLGFAF